MGPIAVGARARALRANTDGRQLLHHSIRNLLFDEELHTGSNLLRFDFDLDLVKRWSGKSSKQSNNDTSDLPKN